MPDHDKSPMTDARNRYGIVSAFIHNQSDEQFELMIQRLLDTPEGRRAAAAMPRGASHSVEGAIQASSRCRHLGAEGLQ